MNDDEEIHDYRILIRCRWNCRTMKKKSLEDMRHKCSKINKIIIIILSYACVVHDLGIPFDFFQVKFVFLSVLVCQLMNRSASRQLATFYDEFLTKLTKERERKIDL